MLNARPGVHGYHYPRQNVTAHPEMGYRFVAPVSRCPDSPKVVGNSATLLVISVPQGLESSPIGFGSDGLRAIVAASPIVFVPRTLMRTWGTRPGKQALVFCSRTGVET